MIPLEVICNDFGDLSLSFFLFLIKGSGDDDSCLRWTTSDISAVITAFGQLQHSDRPSPPCILCIFVFSFCTKQKKTHIFRSMRFCVAFCKEKNSFFFLFIQICLSFLCFFSFKNSGCFPPDTYGTLLEVSQAQKKVTGRCVTRCSGHLYTMY